MGVGDAHCQRADAGRVMAASGVVRPSLPGGPGSAYGIDLDRVGPTEPVVTRLRRRVQGRYPLDAFGGDPLLEDAMEPALSALSTFVVEGEERIPEIGAATFVVSRRPGPGDPLIVRSMIRAVRRRRARIVGYPDLPPVGPILRRLGYVRFKGEDLAVCLRSGHLAIVPLGSSLRSDKVGSASVPVLWGAIGFPIIPVVVRGGYAGPLGLPVGPHRITVGAPLDLDLIPRDPLSAAELGASAREAVQALLDDTA